MTTPDPWDDDRLAAAFTARNAGIEVPPALVTETANAVRQRPTRRDALWWRPLPIAAAAAVVVSIVGLSLAMSWRTGSPLASTEPSALIPSFESPTMPPSLMPSSGSQPDPSVPTVVQGLPVIDVRSAIAVQDVVGDDRELAVHGWLSLAPPMSCAPSQRPVSPLEPFCHSELNWFLQDPEVLVVSDGSNVEIHDPDGPALHPSFAYGPAIKFQDGDVPNIDPLAPWPMIALGHFDDRMAAACSQETRQICEDRFVIDQVAWAFGVALPIVYEVRDEKVRTQPEEIVEILSRRFPDGEVLSLSAIAGAGLEAFDQTLPSVIEQFKDTSRVWLVRMLFEGTPAQTIYVTDDTHEVYLLLDTGEVTRLADPSEPPLVPAAGRALAVVGVDGGAGELRCNSMPFPVSGLVAPVGAEDRVGPEFDVLRATLADPMFADGAADINALSWREAGRTDDTIVFLTEKPRNGDERHWLELSLRLGATGWRFAGGGDCQPRAVLPEGVGPATWILDPAFPEPSAQDSTLHLLVTETACASGESAADRLAPAYVVASPYRIDITIGVHTRPGAQECPGNPPVAVEIDLGTPIGDRPLIDPNAPPPDGSSG